MFIYVVLLLQKKKDLPSVLRILFYRTVPDHNKYTSCLHNEEDRTSQDTDCTRDNGAYVDSWLRAKIYSSNRVTPLVEMESPLDKEMSLKEHSQFTL